MMDSQKFCLKWDGFQSSVTSVFDHLRRDGELVDITLCCEGQRVKAHRMMLSACSPYFRDLLKNNPCQELVFFLKDTSAADLSAIIEFIYKGSVNVAQTQLGSFLKTAEMLQIRGLSGEEEKNPSSPVDRHPPVSSRAGRPRSPRPPPPPPTAKRRRVSDGTDTPGRTSPPPPPPPPAPPAPQPTQQPSGSPAPFTDFSASRGDPASSVVSGGSSVGSPSTVNHAPPSAGGRSGDQLPTGPEPVKVEKVDLTEDEDETSLDATLGYVAEYEGSGYGEHSAELATVAAMAEAAAAMPGGAVAGPSQRTAGDDSTPQAPARSVCDICGSSYKHRESLYHHRKKHLGLTKCPVCGKVCSIVADLRRHMEVAHQLSSEDVRRIIPTKPKERISWGQFMAGR
ncbi:broad-complex core protein isoforms 1/2/3/4/5-like isoform X3 [Amphibalanus amphitrite]|uniref:broad-complex core protein isoforms 1/2/3/4/5-like isoform X3 n=1 Tax=Amphibalanus amphitrite TaxID=1232801 RepID=UPI001C9217D5|nr:broad-complex core protein isoforms 1/2/3/4/5-like isoform X3 [Amphibalanus amphitrite]XP_043211367.1 broad-complex core protein isoforms 1/2/3/4/5-like isoform X3 [Amphibalanus amphitrite]